MTDKPDGRRAIPGRTHNKLGQLVTPIPYVPLAAITLAECRRHLGLSPGAMAASLGISAGNWWEHEAGRAVTPVLMRRAVDNLLLTATDDDREKLRIMLAEILNRSHH